MKIAKIRKVGKRPVYDISVDEAEHYVLDNGVITHNTGGIYSSDTIWIVGRQQEKDGTEVVGYNFIINIEKSRYVKEKSKIPINVTFEGGINKYSGMFDLALEAGYIVKPSKGWYSKADPETGEIFEDRKYRESELRYNSEFWEDLLANTDFEKFIEKKYRIVSPSGEVVTSTEV